MSAEVDVGQPLELIERIAALVPPPRTHRHRYFGVLAPNSPLRTAAVALAAPAQEAAVQIAPTTTGEGVPGVVPQGSAVSPTPEPVPPKRAPAHYLWAVLIARIYEVFPLLCPMCGGQMRIIAFITEGAQIRRILDHIGVDSEPPQISPARGPPLWDDSDAQMDEGVEGEPNWDLSAQPAPDFGDSAYAGQSEVIERATPKVQDLTQRRGKGYKYLSQMQPTINRSRSKVRARVEHAIGTIKRIFNFTKVRYRGLAKNGNRLFVAAALANLDMVRRQLLALPRP